MRENDLMTPSYWMLASSVIVASLGAGHLLLTFLGPKLLPRDRTLRDAMEQVSPVITGQTTIWRAWMGFNASHSMGALLFGLVYGYLALAHGDLLFHSAFLLTVGFAMLVAYVVLAKVYWFITPLVGTSVALGCYVVSVAIARAG